MTPSGNGKVVLVISKLNALYQPLGKPLLRDALDQPLGKPLLRDGFTLVLSAIGDEELGSVLLLDITGSLQVFIKSTFDTESPKCPILLIVHSWHKDRAGCVLFGSHLWKEA